jgi:coproporphyrinogen III oxidase
MRETIVQFLKDLREEIIHRFEAFEKKSRFLKTPWDYSLGKGGGEMAVLRGNVFEKAAVNWSGVQGEQFPMQEASGPFFATGISLITHMHNPHAPTVHMNLRYIKTDTRHWFGGGYDLTPMGFFYEEDKQHFHAVAEKTLGAALYSEFSKNARDYFYIPHRKRERGVGGIFFDYYNTGDIETDFALWKKIGSTFLEAIVPIYQRRIDMPFAQEDRETQLAYRAHYVEFNLLYDRGTQFGFKSGGNPEAILCSLPPLVKW